MIRGFGRVQRELAKIFEHIREQTYSTEELCSCVYHQPYPENRHRVAVLRAIDSVLKRFPWIGKFRGGNRATYYFCDCRILHAYAVTKVRCWFGFDHKKAEERLVYDLAHPSNIEDLNATMKPETGQWWFYCEATRAQFDGDNPRAEALWAKYQEAEKAVRAGWEMRFKVLMAQYSQP